MTPLSALSLRTLAPEPGAGKTAREKLDEIPLGNPVTEKEIAASKPPLTVTVTSALLFDPAVTASELGAADAWNVGVAVASRQWLTKTRPSMDPSPWADHILLSR
ncbi:MAG: hypothetical protein WAL52_18520 [Candidatus Sulfotelmatobacter sp.]